MSITKAISVTTRAKRENEVNNSTYKYITKEEYKFLEQENLLLQKVEFGNEKYGYEFDEFKNMKEATIIMGGSGTGKDSIVDELVSNPKYSSFYKIKDLKLIITIPSKAPIFIEYLKENFDIKSKLIYIEVSKPKRMKRLIESFIKKDLIFKRIIKEIKIVKGQINIEYNLLETSKINIKLFKEKEKEINHKIKEIKLRINRDDNLFQEELYELSKEYSNEIIILNNNNLTLFQACKEVLTKQPLELKKVQKVQKTKKINILV